MKLKIYESNNNLEKEVFLKLFETSEGVTLIAVKEDGEPYRSGNILTITTNGKLQLHACLGSHLGDSDIEKFFKTDELGQIELE